MLRRHNSALVLRTIRAEGPVSRSDVARATGLSKPTVNEVAQLLIEAGYVCETLSDGSDHPARPGRKPQLLSFQSDFGHVLGIDIGANKILAIVADLNGQILASESRRTDGSRSAETLLQELKDLATHALAQAGVERSSLHSVGIATPGVVDPGSGKISFAPQLPGWEGLRLGPVLEEAFPCPVLVDNEVHLAVLAERWRGAAKAIEDAFYVHIGIGIGGGVLAEGKLYRGNSGAAGEIGYLPIIDEEEAPPPGIGHFEHAAGGSAFSRLGRRAAARSEQGLMRELTGNDPERIDAEVVFEAARRGDPAAGTIVNELVRRLGCGVATAVAVLDPAMVIVGGGISQAGEMLFDPLQGHVNRFVPVPPKLVLSALGDQAAALGAVRLAIDTAEQRLFGFTATGTTAVESA